MTTHVFILFDVSIPDFERPKPGTPLDGRAIGIRIS
jgi:hypothetical protein